MLKQSKFRFLPTRATRSALPVAALVILSLLLLLALALPAGAQNSPVFPSVFNVPDGWQPEGIATGRGSSFYVGSILYGAIYGGDLRTGAGEVVVPPQEGRAAIGLDVDERSNAIFVAGGGPALGPVPGSGYVYDLETGEELAAYDFAGFFINDVVVTRDAAYFTDSLQPVLFKVDLGAQGELLNPGAFDVIPLGPGFDFDGGAFPNANGIVATPDGESLIVVNSSFGGLYKVDALTGETVKIDLGGDSVPNGDGLVLAGKRLYVVQNQLNQIAIIDLDASLTTGVVSSEPLTSPDFQIPTTAAKFGNTIYAVNARFDTITPGVPSPNVEFTVVGVPAH